MRIIGGIHRSRILRTPKGLGTRPTSDRVREALFGILSAAQVVENARVLDLYAGSGALALEALSRGAAYATLVESSKDALAAVRANVAALGLGACASVLAADVMRATQRIAKCGPFDLILADPPWSLVEAGTAPRGLAALAREGVFAPQAWVVLEHAARTASPSINGLILFETRDYGDTALAFYKPAILGAPFTDVPPAPPFRSSTPKR